MANSCKEPQTQLRHIDLTCFRQTIPCLHLCCQGPCKALCPSYTLSGKMLNRGKQYNPLLSQVHEPSELLMVKSTMWGKPFSNFSLTIITYNTGYSDLGLMNKEKNLLKVSRHSHTGLWAYDYD